MVIGDNAEKVAGFDDNLARLHVFLDQKISNCSSTSVVVFGRKFRELVKQLVAVDPDSRPSISSALDKLRSILVSFTITPGNCWIYDTNHVQRSRAKKRYVYVWQCVST